jgi:hypothetical protein
VLKQGLFSMEKETIITRRTPLKKAQRAEAPVRTMPMEKAKKLIRKTAAEQAELFRRLAK